MQESYKNADKITDEVREKERKEQETIINDVEMMLKIL
jgi:hypothetical protein